LCFNEAKAGYFLLRRSIVRILAKSGHVSIREAGGWKEFILRRILSSVKLGYM
jgi:hypothetical protein